MNEWYDKFKHNVNNTLNFHNAFEFHWIYHRTKHEKKIENLFWNKSPILWPIGVNVGWHLRINKWWSYIYILLQCSLPLPTNIDIRTRYKCFNREFDTKANIICIFSCNVMHEIKWRNWNIFSSFVVTRSLPWITISCQKFMPNDLSLQLTHILEYCISRIYITSWPYSFLAK